jgi:head-tail adaptor
MTEYSRSNWDATSKRTSKDQIEVDAETMMNNHEITVLNRQLINLEQQFKVSRAEICRIYVAVCGKIERMRSYLEKKPTVMWSPLEDLALTEVEGS